MFYKFYKLNRCSNTKVMVVNEGEKLTSFKWIVNANRCVAYAKLKMRVSSVIDYNILSFEYFELIYFRKER